MLTEILHLFLLTAVILPCILWAFLWVKTFKGTTLRALILHTLIFTVLSALIGYIALRILFSGADESYSVSNKSALGLLGLMILSVFVPACILAFFQTLGDLLSRRNDSKDAKI